MKKGIMFFAILACLSATGCGSGNNSDEPRGNSTTNTGPREFLCSGPAGTQLQTTSGGNVTGPDYAVPHGKVSLTFNQSGADVLVAVDIDSPSFPVFGYGFYVVYDPSVIQFIGYGLGNFLGNGLSENVQIKNQPPTQGASKDIFSDCGTSLDTVIVGHSISGYSASGVSGNGTLGVLRFRTMSSCKTKFLFRDFKMYSRSGLEEPVERPTSYPENTIEFSG